MKKVTDLTFSSSQEYTFVLRGGVIVDHSLLWRWQPVNLQNNKYLCVKYRNNANSLNLNMEMHSILTVQTSQNLEQYQFWKGCL